MTKQTDFEIELARIDKGISDLEGSALRLPIDAGKVTAFVYLLYQRASLTGKMAEFAVAEKALNYAIQHVGAASDLYFLKANLDFKFHRLADVKQDLQMGSDLSQSLQGRTLTADLDFQEGRYDDARKAYETLINDDRTWDNLARLAFLKFKMGDVEGADRLYSEAEDELTAKEMRHFAWVELQRGVLNLAQGRYDKAWDYYRRADRAYSGHWLVDEHMAELLGAQRKWDEAVALYEKVIARVERPEFQQALAELYVSMGKADEAQPWEEKALEAYLQSADRGEVHYYHHLTDFYADVREDGPEAVKWARKDIELRRNFSTLAALAWALYRAGDFSEAVKTMNEALASGVTDARLFFQAAVIHKSINGNGQGDRYLQQAVGINPHHQDFHVHR